MIWGGGKEKIEKKNSKAILQEKKILKFFLSRKLAHIGEEKINSFPIFSPNPQIINGRPLTILI